MRCRRGERCAATADGCSPHLLQLAEWRRTFFCSQHIFFAMLHHGMASHFDPRFMDQTSPRPSSSCATIGKMAVPPDGKRWDRRLLAFRAFRGELPRCAKSGEEWVGIGTHRPFWSKQEEEGHGASWGWTGTREPGSSTPV
mmetsp:Transcript_12448/g.26499  ORF Transcript_12448/g.26499 Transcript_12448/m.26499 type:complete len:141 (+) Transcript_12448:230-652(+)